MRRTSVLSTLALLAVTALVMPVFGKPFEKNVTFGESVKVGSTQLDAGDYKVLVDGNKVTIERARRSWPRRRGASSSAIRGSTRQP